MLAAFIAIALAVGVGSGLTWSRLCLLHAVDDWVTRRDANGLRFQALLIASAAVFFLAELALHRGSVPVPITDRGAGTALLGGVLMAAGAIVNGGCYLGSIVQIGRGQSRFLLTLLGIYLFERVPFPMHLMFASTEMIIPSMSDPVVSLVVVGGAVLAWAALPGGQHPDHFARHWGVLVAALCGTGLFVAFPGVSYGATIAALAHPEAGWFGMRPLLGAAMFAGAMGASALSGLWQPERPDLGGGMRCLAGGYVMAAAARCVPGGSDSWLLWTIPRGGVHGLVAFFAAGTTMLAWCLLLKLSARMKASALLRRRSA